MGTRHTAPRAFAVPTAWASRVPGLDLARAAALIGMFAAHVGDEGVRGSDRSGWGWLWIADGRSSALFAVLSGVTIIIMRSRDSRGVRHAVIRVATRGVILICAGYLLDGLGTPVDVILTNLGLMFLLALPASGLRAPTLFALGGVVLVAGSFLNGALDGAFDGVPVLEKLTSAGYPAIAWTGYVIVGMGIGCLRLRETRTAIWLAWAGSLTAVTGYGVGTLCGGVPPWRHIQGSGPWWSSLVAHSDSPFELMGNTGVALLIVGVCLLVAGRGRMWFPALAFGSMSLTMYVAQLLVIAIVGPAVALEPSNVAFVTITLALMAGATVWRLYRGAGPLERLLTVATVETADLMIRSR